MHDAVTNGFDRTPDAASRSFQIKPFDDRAHRAFVVGRREPFLDRRDFVTALELESCIAAESIDQSHDTLSPLGNRRRFSHRVDDLKLNRRTAAVEHQNIHDDTMGNLADRGSNVLKVMAFAAGMRAQLAWAQVFGRQRHFLHRAVNRAHAISPRASFRRDDFINFLAAKMHAGPVLDGDPR